MQLPLWSVALPTQKTTFFPEAQKQAPRGFFSIEGDVLANQHAFGHQPHDIRAVAALHSGKVRNPKITI